MKMYSADSYADAFDRESAQSYAVIDRFEQAQGFAVNRDRLETAARVLACPVKANPPNWQHGRVIYAAARRYCETVGHGGPIACLDIGTAKGFSALCLQWALTDAGVTGQVTSVDVLDPDAACRRNTVAEISGFLTLRQILYPWPEASAINFQRATGLDILQRSATRIHLAFVDGKHNFEAVVQETTLLASRQQPGDLTIWDDCQIDGVKDAVATVGARCYDLDYLHPLPTRRYAIGVRRG